MSDPCDSAGIKSVILAGKIEKRLAIQALFLCVAFGLYSWLVSPGLLGIFIFDDIPNLTRLDQVKTLHNIWGYTLNGNASSLGRPISYLTFALQADAWPGEPFKFKLVNLCLHLANTLLVCFCCYLLGNILAWEKQRSSWFAVLTAVCWLFLAVHIGTVFYVVQRMTILAAGFSLLAIASFLYGFWLDSKVGGSAGKTIATCGVICGYVLGVLSKENAVLTGFFLATIYFILLRPVAEKDNRFWMLWVVVFGVAPPTMVFLYLAANFDANAFTGRNFTVVERLLTECVILWDYADKILFPTPYKLNINNDDFPLSKGLFDPPTTMLAILAWLSVIGLAVHRIRALPFLAVGVFWFLLGHSLEAGIVPLELYFEHRNYLPSLGMVIGITGSFCGLYRREGVSSTVSRRIGYTLGGLLAYVIVWNAAVSASEAKTWSNPSLSALAALADRPNSLRAWQEATEVFASNGDNARATLLLNAIESRWPGFPGTYLQVYLVGCEDKNVRPLATDIVEKRLKNGRFDHMSLEALDQILKFKKRKQCPNVSWEQYRRFIEALLSNQAFASQHGNLVVLLAIAFNAESNYKAAASALDRYSESSAGIEFYLLKAKFYAYAERFQEALDITSRARQRFASNPKEWLPNRERVEVFEKAVREEMLRHGEMKKPS